MQSLQIRLNMGVIAMTIPEIYRAGASPSDFLMSLAEHSLRRSYSSVETQSVYSTAAADWARVWSA